MNDPAETEPSTSGSTSADRQAAFERIDWSEVDDSTALLSAERIALLVGLLVAVATYVYFETQRRTILVRGWNVGNEDWLFLPAAAIVLAYGVVPLLIDADTRTRVLSRLRTRIPTVLSLAFLVALLAVSLWATIEGFQPRVWFPETGITPAELPPVGFGERATWAHPLGTDAFGYDMVDLLVVGSRPFAYLAVVTLGLIAPLATVVGMAAGYYGGRVDDLLMGYVDVQLSVPAILIYMVAYMFILNSMAMLLVAFGLLSWGGIARIVRSETLQRREAGYVRSAEAVGLDDRRILRRHLLPNVTNTVVPATFHLVAILVLTEAGLAFLGFFASYQSWGMTVAQNVGPGMLNLWWPSAFPGLLIAVTVVALKVAGDGLRDVLDPRGGP